MLLFIDTNEIEHHCDGCGARRRLALASLTAGVEHGEPARPVTPDIIALPPCPACATREFLNRVAAPASGPSSISEHGRAVNAVHAALVAAGQVAPTLRAYFAEERQVSPRAELPWSYSGQPPAVRRRPQPFAEFVRRSARREP